MAAEKTYIEGVTPNGVHFSIDGKMLNDIRVIKALSEVKEKQDNDLMGATAATFKLCKLLFGSDVGVDRFIDSIAEVHDGCPPDVFINELKAVLEKVNAKN